MTVAFDTTYYTAFTTPSAGRAKTTAMLIRFLIYINAFHRTVIIGDVVNFLSTPQIISRIVDGVAAYYHLLNSS